MKEIIKYQCSECRNLFATPKEALAHEMRHKEIRKANKMLDEGCTLKEIQAECRVWNDVPKHLENVTKDNCFVVSWWEWCNKPAYQITRILFTGSVELCGSGSLFGAYNGILCLCDNELEDTRPKEELYINNILGKLCYKLFKPCGKLCKLCGKIFRD